MDLSGITRQLVEQELAKNHTLWHAKAGKQIDYLVIAGDTPVDIVKVY